ERRARIGPQGRHHRRRDEGELADAALREAYDERPLRVAVLDRAVRVQPRAVVEYGVGTAQKRGNLDLERALLDMLTGGRQDNHAGGVELLLGGIRLCR